MKFVMVLALLTVSVSSFASEKVCFGTGDNRGDRFEMSLRATRVTVVAETSEYITSDSYKRTRDQVVQGRDGVTYLDFFLGNSDGANDLLVDPKLLKDGTVGRAKVRNRGEGYYTVNYVCRDKKD